MAHIGWKSIFVLCIMCAAMSGTSASQVFTNLLDFNNGDGAAPSSTMIQAKDGSLYGYTVVGGSQNCEAGCGTLFKVDPKGHLTTFYAFCSNEQFPCAHGMYPNGALIQASDGNFYGTTEQGGAHAASSCVYGCGTIFRITPAGRLTTLYSFCSQSNCADGADPEGALLQASNGRFYGETGNGGNGINMGMGTIFEFRHGKLTTLHVFCANYPDCSDGFGPTFGLIEAGNGKLYGATALGGGVVDDQHTLYGTVFELTLGGKLTRLHSFCSQGYPQCSDGAFPIGQLVQAANGNFYGATNQAGGGALGTIFEITPAGKLTTLHTFQGTDGGFPEGVMLGSNGSFYGSTVYGGANGQGGTLFVLSSGTLTTLYNFCTQTNCTDGSEPAVLTQATSGTFFGTTIAGGAINVCLGGCGTLFSLADGLRPFVQANPGFGKVGGKIFLLGNNLTGTNNVSFHGTSASFQVVSKSEIIAPRTRWCNQRQNIGHNAQGHAPQQRGVPRDSATPGC
jgi:uncharacterized repeat protein (TIGR03803 family)